ncbi:ergothioneine biosynthesis protein EgtB [Legionella sp. W10-070]|uniref:ergothioneine biosynthesis protein EgtB n=1 Tax=unclassified Legionella TaxID=2622702 RepID=UPI001A947F15|nr:ergothioneine biosynthesis protein EgtB [Legionella sp. W10-070]MDI9819511.1 ergothioneine biosynthesis protein EgtB [Legionella sp. PL877]
MIREELSRCFQSIREQTEKLCQPLFTEDYVIQSMCDVSPPKWHLAHTTWFFENFILVPKLKTYQLFNSSFHYLFNSYYQSLGKPYVRARRGLLSRPTTEVIYAYRTHVNHAVLALIDQLTEAELDDIQLLIIWGLQHEQQHQELLLMDIKHNFSIDPDFPSYKPHTISNNQKINSVMSKPVIGVNGGIIDIGYAGMDFCFDNEIPRHKKILVPYLIAPQLVTNGDYLEFINDGGYNEPRWWLADGWEHALEQGWQAPLYWYNFDGEWYIFTLSGLQKLNPAEPVSHVSYYEADAYAKWRGFRLPTEEEWEHVAITHALSIDKGNFLESGLLHPKILTSANKIKPEQFFGDVWEWTASNYSPYPGYRIIEGPLGEYNGKFMSNQIVLRGGSCVTPMTHIRVSYRNFFQPEKRWQFSGIRLAANP